MLLRLHETAPENAINCYNILFLNVVRNSESLTSALAACSKHAAAIGGFHACAKSVLIPTAAVRGLEGSFHLSFLLNLKNGTAKVGKILNWQKISHFPFLKRV